MPPNEPQAVVMRGNPSVGWTLYGPFTDWDSAAEWAHSHQADEGQDWIVTLDPPEELLERYRVTP